MENMELESVESEIATLLERAFERVLSDALNARLDALVSQVEALQRQVQDLQRLAARLSEQLGG